MKIGQSPEKPKVGASPPAASPAVANKAAGQSAAATAQASATSAGVAVTVSTQARSLEQVSGPDSSDSVDFAKVDAVRSAIEQGTYTVNPEAIADKLLANAQEMFNRTQN